MTTPGNPAPDEDTLAPAAHDNPAPDESTLAQARHDNPAPDEDTLPPAAHDNPAPHESTLPRPGYGGPGDGADRPRVLRVAGPLVEITCPSTAAMHDLVVLGAARLPGEVVAIHGDAATVQAYEYTGALAPGHPAELQGHPLSVRLAPDLLGGVFDGLLRPLHRAGDLLTAVEPSAGDVDRRTWVFTPRAAEGTEVAAGDVLGEIGARVPLRLLVPPGRSGRATGVAAAGEYRADAVLAVVGGEAVRMAQLWPVRRPRPVARRLPGDVPLTTGQRAVDLLFPVARGSTVAVPGGFGTGKTMLLQQIAKWCDADVIVYVGCGERGNEMADVIEELAELTDPRSGGRLAERTVTIANTSNMPMMAREASVHTGATVAEYFRDMGLDVVLIADSTSRWAEALREFASRMGELPAEEGYPAGLASRLAAFYERGAAVRTLGGASGSVTVIGAVSPPGGDRTEPVTAHTERFVRCLWSLDRDLAYARHYPAVSWSESFSRDAPALAAAYARAGEPEWAERRGRVARQLAEADRLADLVELVGITALPPRERISVLAGRLLREAVIQQSALSPADAYSAPEKTAALVEAVVTVVDRCLELVDSGVEAEAVEAVDFTPLLRARETAGPAETAPVVAARDTVLARLAEAA
ncbi:V-type ATP synthase subunit A [Streptomyces cinerochromogenes]|uniref:V-type ATP synthase subunit A n=1 Tax=Streptomyces cinerochromogenes TaxID=66422 RepID=UPI00199AFA38|nr:V-type ATP synthase subunit A [Streptomyces cinerochromogenes]GGS55492.1 V-type ATP synthase alpha chain [Streptomyces cinerochromogenes]